MATENTPTFNKVLYTPLAEIDPVVKNIIDKETWRQFSGLELIASEFMEANGSMLTNKYSEGLPGARYYGGNEYIDELEVLCRKRALQAFNLDPEKWGVNVQPYSGSTANFAVLTALIQPQDRLMGLGLPDGGHLTHGYYTAKKKMTASSIYFQSFPYALDPSTQLIDYDGLRKQAKTFKPRLIICGASAYPRDWDYKTLRDIKLHNPFEYCDIVTTTTHKTLRGPRGGMIFFRKDGPKYEDLEKRTIAGVAIALLQVCQPEYKEYARQVIANARTLGSALIEYGYKLQTGGTDNHLVLWDLRPLGLTGSKVEKVCDLLGITINKNAVSGDASAQTPGGIRLGTSALTSRDLKEEDMKVVASFLHRAVQLSLLLQKEAGTKMLKDFVRVATTETKGKVGAKMVKELRHEVDAFARKWPLPGVDVTRLQRPAGIEEDI
ncbi:glycine hydroxymethyltransferase [Pisolithus sp. B1]|nr:glycine hydroxymethyltransferase [Pisolithus sp. B1]